LAKNPDLAGILLHVLLEYLGLERNVDARMKSEVPEMSTNETVRFMAHKIILQAVFLPWLYYVPMVRQRE
jgi:hypothetical protein